MTGRPRVRHGRAGPAFHRNRSNQNQKMRELP